MPRRTSSPTRYSVVLHTRIAINYMTTAQHKRLVIFTIDAGEVETMYVTDLALDIKNLTDVMIKRHLLENLNRATVIHTFQHGG
jgi:hypothetical protein